jgi:hypothetical protein
MSLVQSLVQVALLAVSVQPEAVSVYTLSTGRIAAGAAVVVGLIGAIVGGLALTRSAHPTDARRRATVALVLALIALVVGGLVVITAKGGVGTGGGFGGGPDTPDRPRTTGTEASRSRVSIVSPCTLTGV